MIELAKFSSSHIFEGLVTSLKDHVISDGVYLIDCEDSDSQL